MAITDLEVYKRSNKEINRIRKQIGSNNLSINFDYLDPITAAELKQAILYVFGKRQPDITATLTKVN